MTAPVVVEATTPRAYVELADELRRRDARGSRAGEVREAHGALVVSDDPRERYLDRDGSWNLAFQLQEHWAYWAGANPGHVHRYNTAMEDWMEDGELPGSAYGDRLRNTAGHDQLERAERMLRDSPGTRRALMAVHQPAEEDYGGGDVACTAYLHPFARDGELHMVAAVRSQDLYWGYAYDAANNQFIQELMAERLGLEPGTYWHFMDSCHYYTEYEEEVLASRRRCRGMAGVPVRAADWAGDFEALTGGLRAAREDEVSGYDGVLTAVSDIESNFAADWLKVMAAYELERFRDRPRSGQMAEQFASWVSADDWRDWAERYVGGAP